MVVSCSSLVVVAWLLLAVVSFLVVVVGGCGGGGGGVFVDCRWFSRSVLNSDSVPLNVIDCR